VSAEGAGSARLHEVLDAIPDAIAVLGPGGTVELANRAMRELFAAFGVEAIGLAAVSPERPVRGRLELAAGRRKFVTSAAALGPSGRVVVTLRELGAERDGERLREDLFGLVSHELRTPLARSSDTWTSPARTLSASSAAFSTSLTATPVGCCGSSTTFCSAPRSRSARCH
jgi:PAS domain-containing protein